MPLVCENCGERDDFYKCIGGVEAVPVDGTGGEIGGMRDFEAEGSPWYECAACGSSRVVEAPRERSEAGEEKEE